ncbi:hypothetical protein C0Q70_00091 [Pomacea canaliculata]|uniref:Uncharacterized protein n=1 Tax=Pomacea canaliculata TaxID=400727 RepID=A0A2T7PVS8_POMCA|nr:hypothetical protein C0Q70_00091 [Pomacea canaliculata]
MFLDKRLVWVSGQRPPENMQVKGQSACQLKWKVVTLLVSLCVFIEETKGQVTCTYQQIADTSVDDNYREYELFFNTQSHVNNCVAATLNAKSPCTKTPRVAYTIMVILEHNQTAGGPT